MMLIWLEEIAIMPGKLITPLSELITICLKLYHRYLLERLWWIGFIKAGIFLNPIVRPINYPAFYEVKLINCLPMDFIV
ncbi:hypothetical protein RchiOBHm_Chr5g0041411 [Rosa chinensis]|uniref:Uncharacterized protein n=1 Tax=Rosa chinensis TaxID=74649 RepID=A0A2P6QCS1_ROSCH|nr:hypothetical protein RchiOBHm_Chr5g0041411 [Rosa chinensis]